jgi:hypothetical protein
MDWSDIGSYVSKYAPLVGEALTSPVGAVLGVGTIIANLFGVKADPQSVMDYINGNPEKAEEKLKFEMANNIEFQKIISQRIQEKNRHEEESKSIELQNVISARNNSANINTSPVDNKIKMILVTGQFFALGACILIFYLFREGLDQSVVVTLGALMGSLMNSLGSMINFYWGTSFSSQKKDDFITGRKL